MKHLKRGQLPRRVAGFAAAFGCAVLLAACGVRTTAVPVDAGPAPSRLRCAVDPKDVVAPPAPGGRRIRVYLVCASELESVDRTEPLSRPTGTGDRVRTAGALLDALRDRPSAAEREAGFTSYVPSPLLVSGGRHGDPTGTLRLSRQPEDLPPTALSQIVCTFAEAGAVSGSGRPVLLGGPAARPVRSYVCGVGVRTDPDAAVPTASTPSS